MGEPTVSNLLGKVANFSLSMSAREKAVNELAKVVTGYDRQCATGYVNGQCTSYEKVPVYGYKKLSQNPNSFIVTSAKLFSNTTVQRAKTEITKTGVAIQPVKIEHQPPVKSYRTQLPIVARNL